MQWFLRTCAFSLFLASLTLAGCSSQLSEEETPVVASDEDDPGATESQNDPENP